jgi:hypothetical protein
MSSRYPRFWSGWLLAVVTAGTLLLWLVGCGDDQLAAPEVLTPGDFPQTADQLMTNFRAAYSEMDSSGFAATIHSDFRFRFDPSDVTNLPLPTEYMLGPEVITAAWNMFSGQVIDHPNGVVEAAVSGIDLQVLTPAELEWSEADSSTGFPGSQRRLYEVVLNVERPGNATLTVIGQQEFFVVSRDSSCGAGCLQPFFQLIGQRDLTSVTVKAEQGRSWGQVWRAYFTNTLPVAQLQHTVLTDSVDATFRFDGSDSYDPDGGLHTSPYRWQFGLLAAWSDWSDSPTITRSYTVAPGMKDVFLQVRDRWGEVHTKQLIFPVNAIFPDTEDKLIANFLWAYQQRLLDEYGQLLHPEYQFLLQEEDIIELGLQQDHLNRGEELVVAQNMFSGAPAPGGAPAIAGIDFDRFEPLTVWSDYPDYQNARRRRFVFEMPVLRQGDSALLIEGQQVFIVSAQDSLVGVGTTRPYWQLRTQVDESSTGWKEVGGISWGALKVEYR